jgi:hypothetical protein
MNRIELLRDIYVWGYERSVKHYLSAREELGEPDSFRLDYRKQLAEAVREIVCNVITNKDDYILKWATVNLPETNRSRFIDMVKREVAALHEGNIARFRIKPSEFNIWRGRHPKSLEK